MKWQGIGLCLFMFVGCAGSALANSELPFVEETADAYFFHNRASKLVLDKQTWQMRLVATDGKEHYADCQKPAFLVRDSWVSAEGNSRIDAPSRQREALIRVSGGKGFDLEISVRSVSDYGFRIRISAPGRVISKVRGIIKLNPVEEIYGFGEMWNGHVAQRGQSFELWDREGTPDECAYMPYFVSTHNYAFFLNYGGLVRFDVGQRKSDELVFEAPAGELDMTLVLGETIPSVVRNFFTIIGMPAKPPRWSFKPWFWLAGDPNQPAGRGSTLKGEHFLEIISRLKELDIPIGVTWLEPPWQDAQTSFVPNPEFSPDLKKLIKQIAGMGVKTLVWTVPYTTRRASNWHEAVERGFLVKKPDGGMHDTKVRIPPSGEVEDAFYNFIDYYSPEARQWWQGQIEKALELGIRGFKLDAGQGLPEDGILHGGLAGKDVHNAYALEYNRVFFELLRQKYGDDFLMIPRAAWLGSSAYTNFKWPGDLSCSFGNNGLPASVYSSLSLAFCGFPFVSTDIGGYSGRPTAENVWVRWAQFGAMLPGMQTLHMPWWFSEKAIEHFRYLAWLHTDLTPYWMTLANEAHETGAPVCRPLVWNYQDEIDTWRVHDEFTVGDYLLAAPIINPDIQRDVYLPKGVWFDFWDEKEVFAGPCRMRWFKGREEGKWQFPLYVREGAILPMDISNRVTGFGSEQSAGFVTLAIWPELEAKNEFVLRDREGPVRIVTDWSNEDGLRVYWDDSSEDYLFRVHLKEHKSPSQITARKKTLQRFNALRSFQASDSDGWFFDEQALNLWVRKMRDTNSGELKVDWERPVTATRQRTGNRLPNRKLLWH